MKCLTLLLVCLNPVELVARERVDLIEVNTFYDDNGRVVFDQAIFYDWFPQCGRYQVRAWRMIRDAHQQPEFDHDTGDWKCTWQDGDILRCVTAGSVRRTHSQYDPEVAERDVLAKDKRLELRKELAR